MATSRTYARCRQCGARRDEGASLSKRGYCSDCGPARHKQQLDDLHYHQGPHFTAWRRALAASVGAVLLDDLQEKA
jgi:hypothetical protein